MAESSARIRRLVAGVLVAIFVVPVAIVATIEYAASSGRRDIEDGVVAAARERGDPLAIAREHHVRIRVIAGERVVADSDAQPRASDLGVSSLGVDPTAARVLEAGRPPAWQREQVVVAAQIGEAHGCALVAGDELLQCEAAVRRDDGTIVLAERTAPRVASRLTDVRGPLLALAAIVLAGGAVLAAWLVRRLTRPLAELHAGVLARAQPLSGLQSAAAGPHEPIAIASAPREIADVARAVDTLVTTLDGERERQAVAAADLAHELKGPLARIRIALEAEPANPALVELARAAVLDIDRVVASLLAISRAEAGLRGEPREIVDVAAIARAVVDARDAGAIEVVVHGGPMRVEISEASVERALGHLVDNALAFARTRVAIEIGDADIAISDDGPGVAPDLVARLFERFASRRPGGTGLGLAYVRAVARAHGGDATYAGGRFTMTLPRVHT